MSGMSCSITTIAAPVWSRMSSSTGRERLGLALGDPRRRLVEQEHRRLVGEHAREVDDAPRAGGQLADELVRVGLRAASARRARSTSLSTLRSDIFTAGESRNAASASGTGTWRSNAVAIVSRTVIDGKSRASWNDRPRPSTARASGVSSVRSVSPMRTRPLVGVTNPEMMSSTVVLPAPFGPIMPTISPWCTREVDAVDGVDAAERRGDVDELERHLVRRRRSDRTPRGSGGGARWPTPPAARPRLVAAPSRNTARSRSGCSSSSAVGPSKRTSPFSRNTARSASVMATFTDCSTSTTVVPPSWMARTMPSSCSTTIGARPRLSSSIMQQLGPGDERLPEREHLLLAAGQVAGSLVPALAQHREELEHLLGRASRTYSGSLSKSQAARRRFSATVSVGNTPLPPGMSTMPPAAVVGRRLAGDVLAVEGRPFPPRASRGRTRRTATSTCRRRWCRAARRSRRGRRGSRRRRAPSPCRRRRRGRARRAARRRRRLGHRSVGAGMTSCSSTQQRRTRPRRGRRREGSARRCRAFARCGAAALSRAE